MFGPSSENSYRMIETGFSDKTCPFLTLIFSRDIVWRRHDVNKK